MLRSADGAFPALSKVVQVAAMMLLGNEQVLGVLVILAVAACAMLGLSGWFALNAWVTRAPTDSLRQSRKDLLAVYTGMTFLLICLVCYWTGVAW